MNVSLEDIRAFLVIAELESFSQAADRLSVSQSALSRRIVKIEDHLGARLFDRSTRHVALTAIGREFCRWRIECWGEFERSLDRIGDVILKRGGGGDDCQPDDRGVRGCCRRWRRGSGAAHPDVRLRILDATGPEIAAHVRSGEAEFGIDMEAEPDAEIAFEPLAVEHYVLALPAGPSAGR